MYVLTGESRSYEVGGLSSNLRVWCLYRRLGLMRCFKPTDMVQM